MDDKQQNFYKRLSINIRVKCLKQGIKKLEFCLKQGRKISDICLKQGQGMRGRAAPPHPEIYRVPPPPRGRAEVSYDMITKESTTAASTTKNLSVGLPRKRVTKSYRHIQPRGGPLSSKHLILVFQVFVSLLSHHPLLFSFVWKTIYLSCFASRTSYNTLI